MRVKRMGRVSLGILLLFLVAASAVAQDEPVLSADITLDGNSLYVWRGQLLTNDPVFQPGLSIGAYGFTGSIWANLEMTEINEAGGEFSEIDYALDYSGSMPGFETLGYSAGIIQYVFPTLSGDSLSTTEIYFGAGFDVPLSPSFTYYRDVNNVDGGYFAIGVGHSFEKELGPNNTVGLDLSASFGYGDTDYNTAYSGVESGAWNDFTVGIAVPFGFKGGISLTPKLNISTMLDDSIGTAWEDATGERTNIWFGVSLAKSF